MLPAVCHFLMLPPPLQADGGGAHLLLRQAEGLQPPAGGGGDGADDSGRRAAPQTQGTRQKPVRCVQVLKCGCGPSRLCSFCHISTPLKRFEQRGHRRHQSPAPPRDEDSVPNPGFPPLFASFPACVPGFPADGCTLPRPPDCGTERKRIRMLARERRAREPVPRRSDHLAVFLSSRRDAEEALRGHRLRRRLQNRSPG